MVDHLIQDVHIPLIRPFMNDEIKQKVLQVLESGFLTEGPVTKEFEEVCRANLDVKYSIAVTSCTVGLEMALRCLNIGPGSEVIVPDYTYPATASVVEIVGAKIVIVDVLPKTMLIDYDSIERAITGRTKAVMPVSLFGNPLDYDRLSEICKKYQIYMVEDAACSFGAEFRGRKVGTFADITVFSFHPRKFITTGEGGLLVTDNPDWKRWLSSYKHFGIGGGSSRSDTQFTQIGTNYKMSDILAAIGLIQMKHFDELLSRRRFLVNRYLKLLAGHPEVEIPQITPYGTHSYQSFCVLIKNRDKVMNSMREEGIEVQIGSYALHLHKAFNENSNCRISNEMVGSYYAFNHCLSLPLYHHMTDREQQYVVEMLLTAINKES